MSDNDELEKLRRLLEYTRESRDAYGAIIARALAALRLIEPDHITPTGARVIREALEDV